MYLYGLALGGPPALFPMVSIFGGLFPFLQSFFSKLSGQKTLTLRLHSLENLMHVLSLVVYHWAVTACHSSGALESVVCYWLDFVVSILSRHLSGWSLIRYYCGGRAALLALSLALTFRCLETA